MKIYKFIVATSLLFSSSMAIAEVSSISTSADGYLQRGVEMFNRNNYLGCIDQLTHAQGMVITSNEAEMSALYIAMAEYHLGSSLGETLLKGFIEDYPYSLDKSVAQYYLGNYYFFKGKFGEAATNYAAINGDMLTQAERVDMNFRLGYSLLRIGEYDTAGAYFQRIANNPKYKDVSILYQGYLDYINKDYTEALAKFSKLRSNSPLSLDSYYYIAQIYFIQGDYTKAITYGTPMLNRANSNSMFRSEMHRIVGESEYQLGNDIVAIVNIEKYLETTPSDELRSALYLLGVLDFRRMDYQATIDNMAKVVANGDDAMTQSAYIFIGQSYLKLEKMNSASIAFEKAFKLSFDKRAQEIAFYNYALAQQAGGRTPFNKAIEIFDEFRTSFPNSEYNASIDEYIANVYMNDKDYDSAFNSISKIRNPSANVFKVKQYIMYKLAIQMVSNGNTERALELFSGVKILAAENQILATEADLWIGDIAYANDDYAKAEKIYTKYLKSANAQNKAIGYYNLGYAQFQQKDYANARKSFYNAINAKVKLSADEIADASNRIGDCCFYVEEYTLAYRYYNEGVNSDKVGDYALYQVAIIEGLQRKHTEKIATLSKMLSRFPKSNIAPKGLMEQAKAYISINKQMDAMTLFRKVVDNYPSTIEAREAQLQLAITSKSVGKDKDAIKYYKEVITNYPSSEEAAVAIEDLKIIYADNNKIDELNTFLNKTPNAPGIDVTEADKLTFLAAEKSYIDNPKDISKLQGYIQDYSKGVFVANAQYYIAKYNYSNKSYDDALKSIDVVLSLAKDASFAEDALAMKCEILTASGDPKDLLKLYKELELKATTNDNRVIANLGVMRTAKIMDYNQDVVDSATKLLSLSGLTADEEKEARMNRALAYISLNQKSEAIKDLTKLAEETKSVYGVKGAYTLAELSYENKDYSLAEEQINDIIDKGTPHHYWLARSFILLSDIYAKTGNAFEAKEYLESLKGNYPGSETEIYSMIEERLTALK
ncbi:MAG: tetratricopeptide repeat protein [Bacteroidales bacterium]